MKRLRLLSIPLFVVLFVGCSYNELPEELGVDLPIDERISLNVETRAEVYNGEELDREYFVTATDLENFVKFRRNTSKRSNLSVKEVKSYGFDSSQTLFYILNYNDGWEVVAADKRVQPSLAHGDSGEFTMDCDNEPMKFWMNMLAEDVLQTRRNHAEPQSTTTSADTATTNSTNSGTPAVSSSEEQYVDFWVGINATEDNTKVKFPSDPIPVPDDMYRYRYLIDTEQETVNIDIGPLLETTWGQSTPWNTYCPLKTDGSNERAPAGCVAVAGAQTMYYLRNFFDLEVLSPISGICTGNINNYQQTLTNLSYTAWDNMAHDLYEPTYNTNLSALLLAYIGMMLEVDYGNDGTSADTMDLPDKVFTPYGIDCNTSDDYDSDHIIQNVTDSLPVILRGRDALLFGSGHAWVTDGYRREVIRTTKYYIRSVTMLTQAQLAELDKTDANQTVVEDSLTAEYIHMNWGWSASQDRWFSLAPEEWWLKDNNGDDFRLRYYIKMIHDFRPNN